MAPLQSLVCISAALGMAFAVSVVTNEKDNGLIRREAVGLDPKGKVTMTLKQNFQAKAQASAKDITECDRQFVLMAEGAADECTGSPFLQMTDEICQFAAKKLASVVVDHHVVGYFMNNTNAATLDHPTDCFYDATAGTFHYNPLESHPTNTLTGRKLCIRSEFVNGTANTDASSGCAAPAVPIMDYDECFDAADCAGGGEVCRMDAFQENETNTDRWKEEFGPIGDGAWKKVPQGCFKMPATHPTKPGCWNFSPLAPEGTPEGDYYAMCKNVVPTDNVFPGGLQSS